MKWKNGKRIIIQFLLGLLIPDTWKNIPKIDVLLIGHDHHFNFLHQGKLYSPLLGSMKEYFNKNGMDTAIILRPFSVTKSQNAWHEHQTFNRHYCLTFIIRFLGRFYKPLHGLSFAREEKFWTGLLARTKPTRIVAIQPEAALCRAARKLGIKIADLQHGVINDLHPWYGTQFRSGTPINDLPTEFLVWDEQSANAINKWATDKKIHVLINGNPWIKRFRSQQNDDFLVLEALKNSTIFTNKLPKILVSLQWGLDELCSENNFNGIMVSGLEKLILRTRGKYNWMLRLHPVQLHGTYRLEAVKYLEYTFGRLPCVEWQKTSLTALPIILSQTSLHLTFSSSVIIEASWFGIRSAILDPEIEVGGVRDMNYILERSIGIATVVGSREKDIENWIFKNLH
ncbi:MAG: hypothetical protein PHS32_14145 [Rhodoferax sp.]|uniref:hypothetical protein n=1 Tax=Rhodoferax sp. TaxID=50421 RepID=UPI00260B1E6A|nr:hypothetical protein [Rhodoferax sp.]MDD5334871.1 hypothetical protein [Rhodoferax sp.]